MSDLKKQCPVQLSTSSSLITEVNHAQARLVLGWETSWEHLVFVAARFNRITQMFQELIESMSPTILP